MQVRFDRQCCYEVIKSFLFLGATVSLAKFCSLRPAHVKLCSKDFDVTSMLQVDFTESDAQEDDEPTHRIKKER